MPQTAVYNLRYAALSDSPDIPFHTKNLADDVEATLQGDLELGGSLEVATSLAVGTSANVTARLDVGGHVAFAHADMKPVRQLDTTDILAFTGSTPLPGSPVVGFTFNAPPSGWVWISTTGDVRCNALGARAVLGWEMKTGSTIGSGSVVAEGGANPDRGVVAGPNVVGGGPAGITSTNRHLVTALTPGSAYNVRALHWIADGAVGNSGDVRYRCLTKEPVL